jgi:hypothetical protein
MSPAVVATWITEQHGDEPVQLRLVILWRGTPGWFVRAGGSSVSGGGSAGGEHQTSSHTIIQGGIRLTFDFDAATGAATILGKRLDLREDNVVLVDDVDSPEGPRVSGTMRVTRAMPGSAGQIGLVLRMSPEIMTFLRCDAVVPDGPPKALIERLCLQNLGVAR